MAPERPHRRRGEPQLPRARRRRGRRRRAVLQARHLQLPHRCRQGALLRSRGRLLARNQLPARSIRRPQHRRGRDQPVRPLKDRLQHQAGQGSAARSRQASERPLHHRGRRKREEPELRANPPCSLLEYLPVEHPRNLREPSGSRRQQAERRLFQAGRHSRHLGRYKAGRFPADRKARGRHKPVLLRSRRLNRLFPGRLPLRQLHLAPPRPHRLLPGNSRLCLRIRPDGPRSLECLPRRCRPPRQRKPASRHKRGRATLLPL